MKFIFIYITHPDMKTAKKIAEQLLAKRLIACVNYFPIQSSYWWRSKIENSKEIVTIVKTRKENWRKVKAEVEKIHPYETPCIMKMEVEANADYAKWIQAETK
jgi:periplasmic divalent cation tolerance protein